MSSAMLLSHLRALPEIWLLAATCAVLLIDVYSKDARRRLTFCAAQVAVGVAFALTLYVLYESEGTRQVIFSGLYVSDVMGHLLKLVCYLGVSAALLYSQRYLADRDLLRGEFVTLLLFCLLGMMVMISAASFLTLFLGLELMSLCLYALVALNRDSAFSTEAAMKYFVLGALSSGLLLYGMSMIYGATGTLNIYEVAEKTGQLMRSEFDRRFLVFGLVFVVAGLAFKVGVVPFHMWIPDVYHGAPTAVTLIVGTAPKLAAFAMAMRLLVNGLIDLAQDWQQMLALLAVLSMALGNITAIAQTNLKRMLAYSTIAHMGFMLLGMLSGVVDGNRLNGDTAYSSALFYMIVYVLMSLGAFGVLLYCSRAGFECENLDDLKGLNRTNPWFAFLMLLLMFSLAGIPPTAGFYAKLSVLSAAVNAGQVWLAVVAVMFSLIGAFYYLRVVKLMYFDEPKDAVRAPGQLGFGIALSANGLALLLFGILPQPLMAICFIAIRTL
jgi:NADH-quinone oxidoreductase subunit N